MNRLPASLARLGVAATLALSLMLAPATAPAPVAAARIPARHRDGRLRRGRACRTRRPPILGGVGPRPHHVGMALRSAVAPLGARSDSRHALTATGGTVRP